MTAVAVKQYRPAMDSCMVGMRLYRTCALTALRVRRRKRSGRVSGRVFGWRRDISTVMRGPKVSQVRR